MLICKWNDNGFLGMGSMKNGLMLAVLLVLAGCQSFLTEDPPLRNEPEAIVLTPEPGLTDQQRLRKAIALLSKGDAGQAEVELQAYLDHVKKSRVARILLEQIQTPVEDYFPAEFVAIMLSNGESLSTIAKQYLGDALQFYALAQYNNIENPGKTTIGQVIHVPLTDKTKAFLDFKINKGMDTSSTAQDRQADGEFKDQLTDDELQDASSAEELIEVIEPVAITSIEQVRPLLSAKRYQEAVSAFERLETTQVLNDNDKRSLIAAYRTSAAELALANPVLASTYYQRAGNLIANTGNKELALAMFKFSKQLNENNGASANRYARLKLELTNTYHRDASLAFRRQELTKAIELWEKVLRIDPGHEHAAKKILQAQKLKENLLRLE